MASTKNILVGAARVFISNGSGYNRPDITASGVFPWSVTGTSNSYANATASTNSTPQYLNSTAAGYWRDLGYTNNGVEISYEPGYGDVMVDQLLDAARLFKQTIRVLIRTELTEGTLENLHIVLGQPDTVLTYSPGAIAGASAANTQVLTTNAASSVTQLNLSAGALGDAPVERSMVLVGNAPGFMGQLYSASTASTGSATALGQIDISRNVKKERVYVARRVVQIETTAHALKRDSATVFPVQFRCLPDDSDNYDGSEYGFIIDRLYG